jgi:hypothetical protein
MSDFSSHYVVGILLFFSLLLLILAVVSIFFLTENGVITKKSLWISTILFFLSGLCFTGVLMVIDPGNIGNWLVLLCVLLMIVISILIVHLPGISFYNSERAKGNLKEVAKVLKSIFPFK